MASSSAAQTALAGREVEVHKGMRQLEASPLASLPQVATPRPPVQQVWAPHHAQASPQFLTWASRQPDPENKVPAPELSSS